MTRPVHNRLPGIKVRRQQRRDFKAIKARVDASPGMAAYREANRRQAAAHRARQKVYKARQGLPTRPLSAAEFAASTAAFQAEALQLGIYTAPS